MFSWKKLPWSFRVKQRGKGWGVQRRRRGLWRWTGVFGDPKYGTWPNSEGALMFANMCERVEARNYPQVSS